MTAESFVQLLDEVRRTPRGWSARCPSHDDRSPSLSVKEGDRGLLLKCWAGCSVDEIARALGIKLADLFFGAPTSHGPLPAPKTPRLDLRALAFRFELAALDRRLRAGRVMQAISRISISECSAKDCERLMEAEARAYADLERAECFEGVADHLRWKTFTEAERTTSHAV